MISQTVSRVAMPVAATARLFYCVTIAFLVSTLAACGGGGGGDDSSSSSVDDPVVETTTIAGSVAGTTIIALNGSGDIVSTDDTGGRARDVDSDGNGTLDAYSFVLNEIPLGEDVRIFLVTGGGIYPMYFDTDDDGIPDSNVFALASGSSTQLSLDFIDVDFERGRAIPSFSPTDDSAVTGGGVVVAIPSGLNEPPTSDLTVAELNTKGKNALASGWVLGAKTYFEAAANLAVSGSDNDADIANFMLALTRVSALGFDTLSDGNAQDMGRLGDFFDLFNVADDSSRSNWDLVVEPQSLPDASPTGNDVRDFFYDVVRPELQAAAENLDDVSASFDTVFTNDDEDFNADHGDALFFAGLYRSMITNITILRAYNVDIDIDDAFNFSRSAEYVQSEYPSLLGQPDSTKYNEARTPLTVALERIKSAIDWIDSETDDQTDDLITLDEDEDLVEIKTWIDEAQSSIEGDSQNIDNVAADLQAFFNNGIVLDDTTLPGIQGNHVDPADGFFDDPTFGGVIVDTDTSAPGIQDINEDIDPNDGIADILELVVE